MSETINEWWDSFTEEQKRLIKDLVIARLRQLPDNFRLSMG